MLTRPLPLGGLLASWFLGGVLVGGGFLGMSVGLPFLLGGLLLVVLLILRSSVGPPGWFMGLAGVGAGLLAIPALLYAEGPGDSGGLGVILLTGGSSALIVGLSGCWVALKARHNGKN